MLHNNAVSNDSVVSHQSVCDVMAALLRAAALKHTDDQLSALSGVPARTIKSYRIEGKEPSLSNALSIAIVLGDGAVNSILSIIGYSARGLEQSDEPCPMQLTADAMKGLAVIASAAADGRIDHLEAPVVRENADAVIRAMAPLSTAGQ